MTHPNGEALYNLLGVPSSADQTEIHDAFVQQRRELSGIDARRLREARDELWSPDRRAVVDALMPQVDGVTASTEALGDQLLAGLPGIENEEWYALVTEGDLLLRETHAYTRALLEETWVRKEFTKIFPRQPPDVPAQKIPALDFAPTAPVQKRSSKRKSSKPEVTQRRTVRNHAAVDSLLRSRGADGDHESSWRIPGGRWLEYTVLIAAVAVTLVLVTSAVLSMVPSETLTWYVNSVERLFQDLGIELNVSGGRTF